MQELAVVWDQGSSLRLADESKVDVAWDCTRLLVAVALAGVAWDYLICTTYPIDVPKFFKVLPYMWLRFIVTTAFEA